MHNYNWKSCSIIYNSDMSGDTVIVDKVNGKSVSISGYDILDFVASYIRDKKVSALENMSTDEILGL